MPPCNTACNPPLAHRMTLSLALVIARAWLRRALVLPLLLLALAGCASLPAVDRPALASEGIPVSTQPDLGRIASAYLPEPLHSGFRLMPLGSYSLDTRVELARRAQVSLDVQYYHFATDETGRWLLRALRDAALRGGGRPSAACACAC